LLLCYKNSLKSALAKLYPGIGLRKENYFHSKGRPLQWCFIRVTDVSEGWKVPSQQRKFFDRFARTHNFDPLEAEKWYGITQQDILHAVSSLLRWCFNQAMCDFREAVECWLITRAHTSEH
jgi:hypothetical protein